jgi:general secretion pathway protein G
MLERRCDGRWGLTLIDILILITLLSLLAALIGPRIVGRMSQTNSSAAKVQSSWK